ncbi:uncharacterized protein LOC130722702 [Lotus japonicus]|uniref:uncharacterized protein LOC130722702 n=1 Tax=Lotus japonicus TaxID=34305 RepID=UPI00258E77FF|nr:uncharacterized protein LOC130722702 [Lotus japonicus]
MFFPIKLISLLHSHCTVLALPVAFTPALVLALSWQILLVFMQAWFIIPLQISSLCQFLNRRAGYLQLRVLRLTGIIFPANLSLEGRNYKQPLEIGRVVKIRSWNWR